jgi:hypothetical protein
VSSGDKSRGSVVGRLSSGSFNDAPICDALRLSLAAQTVSSGLPHARLSTGIPSAAELHLYSYTCLPTASLFIGVRS